MKNVHNMTRAEIEAVKPRKKWDERIVCSSLVIIPLRKLHDSGYRYLDFLAVGDKNQPLCRVSGCSDVLNLDGIGGYGDWDPANGLPRSVEPKGWSLDCLPKSGLLRLFCRGGMTCGAALSNFSIYGSAHEKVAETA